MLDKIIFSSIAILATTLPFIAHAQERSEVKKVSGYAVTCFSEGDLFELNNGNKKKSFNLCEPKNTDLVIKAAKGVSVNFGLDYKAVKLNVADKTADKGAFAKNKTLVVLVNEKDKTIQPDERVYVYKDGTIIDLKTKINSNEFCLVPSKKGAEIDAVGVDDYQGMYGCSYAAGISRGQISTIPTIDLVYESLGMANKNWEQNPEKNKNFVEYIKDMVGLSVERSMPNLSRLSK